MKTGAPKTLSLLLIAALLAPAFPARADAAPAESAPKNAACPVEKAMSAPEHEQFVLFNATLSHLRPYYGRADFEKQLETLLQRSWPRVRMSDVSPLFYERVQGLVDRARMNHAVARTIGLDHADFQGFDWIVHSISLHGSTGHNLKYPIDRTTTKLLKTIGAYRPRTPEAEVARAEALLRVTDMYMFLTRWRALNGEIIDARAAAGAKTMAVLGLGLVGASVMVSTTVFSGPVVAAAGAWGATTSANPVIAGLMVKLAESAAAAAMGFAGAPAALATQQSYRTLSEAAKRSANGKTSYVCELSIQIAVWREKAPDELMTAALVGASLGVGGGVLTMVHPIGAKAVLASMGLGISFSQAYTIYEAGKKTVEVFALYDLAEKATARGDEKEARELLLRARDTAQAAGDKALEAVIVATLTIQVGLNLRDAIRQGQAGIRQFISESGTRQLWAASADTVPSAAFSVRDLVKGEKAAE